MALAGAVLRRAAVLMGVLSMMALPPTGAAATAKSARRQVILRTVQNSAARGDRVYLMEPDGTFLVATKDLEEYGVDLQKVLTPSTNVSVSGWLYLRELAPHVRSEASFSDLTMRLFVEASAMRVARMQAKRVSYLLESGKYDAPMGGFLNYYGRAVCRPQEYPCQITTGYEAGINLGPFLLYSDFAYDAEAKFWTRGRTYLLRDFPARRTRLTVGDVLAFPAPLGGGGSLLGVGYSTDYAVDPRFIWSPLVGVTGLVTSPSQVEVYGNGALLERASLAAGPFEIANLQPGLGYRKLTVVLRDAFGREQLVTRDYFMPTGLLAQGLSEKRFYLGMARVYEGDGTSTYGAPSALASYRLGLTPWWTLGVSGEGGVNAADAVWEKRVGLLALSNEWLVARTSAAIDVAGSFSVLEPASLAWRAELNTVRSLFSWRISLMYREKNYRGPLDAVTPAARTRYAGQINTAIFVPGGGSLNFGGIGRWGWDRTVSQIGTVAYNHSLPWSFFVSLMGSATRSTLAGGETTRPVKTLTFMLSKAMASGLSAAHSYTADNNDRWSSRLRMQKTPPAGVGVGGWVDVTRDQEMAAKDEALPDVRANATWRANRGIITGEVYNHSNAQVAYSFTAAGAVLFVGKNLGLSRPVVGSFALVDVGDVADAPILFRNQRAGTTNSAGKLIIPDLLPYDANLIAVDVTTLPLDVRVDEPRKIVVPSYRRAAYVAFGGYRFRAVRGTLAFAASAGGKGGKAAVDLGLFAVRWREQTKVSPVGYKGNFYFEGLTAGSYTGTLTHRGAVYSCPFQVTEDEAFFINVGEVLCEAQVGD